VRHSGCASHARAATATPVLQRPLLDTMPPPDVAKKGPIGIVADLPAQKKKASKKPASVASASGAAAPANVTAAAAAAAAVAPVSGAQQVCLYQVLHACLTPRRLRGQGVNETTQRGEHHLVVIRMLAYLVYHSTRTLVRRAHSPHPPPWPYTDIEIYCLLLGAGRRLAAGERQ